MAIPEICTQTKGFDFWQLIQCGLAHLGPLHMSPVDRADPVSEISPYF